MTIFEDYKNNITVRVEPKYDELKSNPQNSLYVFSYDVSIVPEILPQV